MAKTDNNNITDPYIVRTDSGERVNVRNADPQRQLKIHGHQIRVKDIPVTAARLNCGHTIRGVAFIPGMLVHCDKHGEGNLKSATVVAVQ